MGNNCGGGNKGGEELDKDALANAKRVEEELLRERFAELFNFKILLLGAGESGKSTVVKQLRLIHNKKPNKQELVTIGDSLHQNVIDCTKALLYACKKFKYEVIEEKHKNTAKFIMEFDEGNRISPDQGDEILELFHYEPMQNAYGRRAEFWLLDSCSYYIKNLERFCEVGFTPTEEDQVMARIRTTGIVVSMLEQKVKSTTPDSPKVLKFQIVDVGGQRNERKKWIHCFDDVKAILFIENLAGYNQVLFEDAQKNRMYESLELFADITHRHVFQSTPFFLFLNKKDLFESMISDVGLDSCFPEFQGGQDLTRSLQYVEYKFREQLPIARRKELMVQVVTGVWKRDIKCAFEEVKKSLIESNKKVIEEEKNKIKKEEKKLKKGSLFG